MLIREVADPNTTKLFGLAEFLLGRANDEAAPKQINTAAFIKLAREMGITVTPSTLADLVASPPLNNIVEPIEPGAQVIKFKSGESPDVAMPVNKAQDIVASAAKRAASKRD
jgi:hypothetical protein